MEDLKELKRTARGCKILYVEDNDTLREKVGKLLDNFFEVVDLASGGKAGLEIFKKKHHHIVISDIRMPNMNGLEFASRVRQIHEETKVIILSAFDDKEYLIKALEIGVFRYLTKPINVTELTTTLKIAVTQLKETLNKNLFHTHLRSIFNYQGSMIMMLNDTRPIIANDILLDYFDVETVDAFRKKYISIATQFLPHNGFLYQDDAHSAMSLLKENEKKIFHVKMKDKKEKVRHFILKYQRVPEKDAYGILSFDDVTELNLLKLFDEQQSAEDISKHDAKAMMDLLEVMKRNNAKIELHNYYKGLSITNDALVLDIGKTSILVSTSYQQQKAIQFEGKTYIVSEALPFVLEASTIPKITFEKQNVELGGLKFVHSSPVERKTIRVIPDEKHTASLFIGENKFHGDVTIEDLSLDAVRLKLSALPAGLDEGSKVILDLVFEVDKRPLIVNVGASVYKKRERRHSFDVVFKFSQGKKSELVKYITKRQMATIREFKGIQNG